MSAAVALLLAGASCGRVDSPPQTEAGGGNRGGVLETVRARGALRCGISQGAGFATPDDQGRWRGFDVDFCRAIAVAVLGDSEAVAFIPYTMQQRFSGLQSGEVDVLVNGTSITSSRAMGRGFHFGPIYLYDGQGFLLDGSLNVTSAVELDGASVCVRQGTTTELNLTDFARRHGIQIRPVVIEDLRAAVSAVAGSRCDAITQDMAGLATTRTMLADPARYRLLPDRISKEPIAPVVRFGDDAWLEVINWVFWATIQAEEFNVTRDNVADALESDNPTIRRFLGLEPGIADAFGLNPRWPYHVIEAVGNYGEIFERHLGPDTPLGLPRGPNRLWTDGGLLYAPPFR